MAEVAQLIPLILESVSKINRQGAWRLLPIWGLGEAEAKCRIVLFDVDRKIDDVERAIQFAIAEAAANTSGSELPDMPLLSALRNQLSELIRKRVKLLEILVRRDDCRRSRTTTQVWRSPLGLIRNFKIGLKMKSALQETFNEVVATHRRSDLDIESLKTETWSYCHDPSKVYGRDIDKENLIERVTTEASLVIAIVGMARIGKTTLVQLGCDDDRIKGEFFKIWVSVPYSFDLHKISRVILETIYDGQGLPDLVGLDNLLRHVSRSLILKDEKVLLILDGVCRLDPYSYQQLRGALKHWKAGSKILVTTQYCDVARRMEACDDCVIFLDLLSEDHCLSIFTSSLGPEVDEDTSRLLEDNREQIAKKCSGVPCLANALGSHMNRDKTRQHWKEVLESNLAVNKDIFKSIFLNFYELPDIPKYCFLCCSVLQKNCDIEVDKLVQLWTSLLGKRYFLSKYQNLEEKCRDAFKILADRCFFQGFQRDDGGNITHCKMNGAFYDFIYILIEDEHLWFGSTSKTGVKEKESPPVLFHDT